MQFGPIDNREEAVLLPPGLLEGGWHRARVRKQHRDRKRI